MASPLNSLEKNLTCGICQEIYKEPVILLCSHSFCKACLEEDWRERGVKVCPFCRKRSFIENPPVNEALRSACESFIQEKKRCLQDEYRGVLCSVHKEKVHLFCLTDQKLVCASCVSQQHHDHNFCSISRAALEFKGQLKNPLKLLKAKLSSFSSARITCHSFVSQIKDQSQQTERKIKNEFEKLHQFLRDEEEVRIAALKEEEKKKIWRMKEKISEFDKMVSHIAGKMNTIETYIKDDETLFLANLVTIEMSAQCPTSDPKQDSRCLIDVAKHVGSLRYKVWEKMKNLCPYFPVILDPNTAKGSTALTDELNGVSLGVPVPNLPNNPERFSVNNIVLGSEGFITGSHSWEVEVGQSEQWIIGVLKQSVQRKEPSAFSQANGFWSLSLQNGSYSWSLYAGKPQRIRVHVDWEKGQVEFTDPESNTSLHTYNVRFTERIYPFFYTISKCPLRILPAKVIVNVGKTEVDKEALCPITTGFGFGQMSL